jgi:hypothetical protein
MNTLYNNFSVSLCNIYFLTLYFRRFYDNWRSIKLKLVRTHVDPGGIENLGLLCIWERAIYGCINCRNRIKAPTCITERNNIRLHMELRYSDSRVTIRSVPICSFNSWALQGKVPVNSQVSETVISGEQRRTWDSRSGNHEAYCFLGCHILVYANWRFGGKHFQLHISFSFILLKFWKCGTVQISGNDDNKWKPDEVR